MFTVFTIIVKSVWMLINADYEAQMTLVCRCVVINQSIGRCGLMMELEKKVRGSLNVTRVFLTNIMGSFLIH